MLCSPIYKYLRKKIKRNILIVGTKNSGKTALLYRLVLNKFITNTNHRFQSRKDKS